MEKTDRLERYRWLYAGLRRGWQHATARYESWVQSCLSSQSRVLDLGCGRGGIVERLHGLGHWTGADSDWQSLREHRVPTLQKCQANSARLPYSDGAFDLVVASWLIEHLAHPDVVFSEVTRVLKPGGSFIFLTPNVLHPIPRLSRLAAGWARLQRRWVWWQSGRLASDAFPVYYRGNSAWEIQHLAADAGMALARLELVDDPSYFAWGRLAFSLAVLLELCLPAMWRVHIIGWYTRPEWS